ncbi:lipopolysaccharide biosynthesis protein [Pseudoalteromonas gelatinilytica]
MSIKKQLLSNLFGIGLIDGLNLLIPLLSIPILSRVLGPEQYGVYLLIMTIVMFGYTFVDYSSNYVGVRQLSQAESKAEKGTIFVNHFAYRLIFLVLYIVCAYFAALVMYPPETSILVLTIGLPFLMGYMLTNTWFYIGTSNTLWLAILSAASKVVHLLIILLLVKGPNDLATALHSMSLPTLLAGLLLSTIIVRQYIHFPINWQQIKQGCINEIKSGANVFTGLLAPNLYNALPIIVLAAFYSKLDYALLASAIKVVGVIFIVQNVFAKAVFPILSKAGTGDGNLTKVLQANLLVTTVMTAILFVQGEWLVTTFLGNQYAGSYQYLIVLALSSVFVGVANTYGQGFLLANGFDKDYRKITVYSSIISCIIMCMSVYLMDLFGFVIAILIARLILAIGLFSAYQKHKHSVVKL